jgi:hypothetical protein
VRPNERFHVETEFEMNESLLVDEKPLAQHLFGSQEEQDLDIFSRNFGKDDSPETRVKDKSNLVQAVEQAAAAETSTARE